jgi:hypothetical protein
MKQEQEQPKTNTNSTKAASKQEQSRAGSNSAEREQARPKVNNTNSAKTKAEPKAKTQTKSAPKTEKPKLAWRDFSSLFDNYLRTKIEAHVQDMAKKDAVFAEKMKANGKSMKDCLNYIGEHFYRQAEKQRKSGYVGIGGNDDELCGLAVHYFDETDESLKEELKK